MGKQRRLFNWVYHIILNELLMRISNFFLYILILFIIMGCDEVSAPKIFNLPEPSEFQRYFQWFIEIFTPDNLTNPERVILLLLSVVFLVTVFGVINSNQLLDILKKDQFNFFPITWLLRLNSHPGWTFGIVISLIFILLVVILILLFIVVFYLVSWLIPWVIFIGFAALYISIILFIIGVIGYIIDGIFNSSK